MSVVVVQCPYCDCRIKADERLKGKLARCPGCNKSFLLHIGTTEGAAIQSDEPQALARDGQEPSGLAGAKRLLSLPWLILLFIFGFLPWSEVSCASKDFHWHVGQSGYQALYGGVSSPFDSLDAATSAAKKEAQSDKTALSKNLETERSDFLMACSPFLVIFWASAAALLLFVILIPLGGVRLKISLLLAGIMTAMLVVTLVVGTPLERRMERAVHEAIRHDPDSAIMMAAAITSGKTFWFWLTLTAVLLAAVSESVANLLWKTFELARPSVLAVVGGWAALFAIAGVGTQVALWHAGLTVMESRLAQLHQAEQEKLRKAEEAEKARQQERELAAQRANQARQAELRKQREASEARQKELAQEQERLRLEAERLRLQQESEARELAKKQAAEAERRQLEREKKEAELKAEEEKAARQYDVAEGLKKEGKLEEALSKLDQIARDYPEVPSAQRATSLKHAIEREIKKNEEPASNAWLFARRLYLDGDPDKAHERLKEVRKKYPGTGGARQAKDLQEKIEKEHPELKDDPKKPA